MHELALSRTILGIAARAAAGRPVRRVLIAVGALRQVVPETLVYCWSLTIPGTPLAGAELVTETIPAVLVCRHCGAETRLDHLPSLRCAACQSEAVDVVTGEEFLVRAIDVE